MAATTNPNKALWEKGDFTRIAESMRESGEALVMTLGIAEGLKVLDLGSGDGTTALPAARLGADVLGVDIASNLVAAGNERARSAGLANLRFQEGDTSDLSELEDDSFDLVISIFGAMFAPRPCDTARRSNRHGELDPQRPDARRSNPEDQHLVLAATPGRVRQPDDVGHRGRRDRAVHGRRDAGREHLVREG